MARLCPASDAYPIFPTYDLGRQVAVLRLVAAQTDVPVPAFLALANGHHLTTQTKEDLT